MGIDPFGCSQRTSIAPAAQFGLMNRSFRRKAASFLSKSNTAPLLKCLASFEPARHFNFWGTGLPRLAKNKTWRRTARFARDMLRLSSRNCCRPGWCRVQRNPDDSAR